MKILCIDGYNFMHRARSGFQLGDYAIIFNFMRNLRALVEMHKPARAYFVIEGNPKHRFEALPEYKANRVVEDDGTPQASAKIKEIRNFWRQKNEIIKLMSTHFPLNVIHHPDHECDDVIYNLIQRSSSAGEWIVASNDSDFIQLLNQFGNVKVYNPMTKSFVVEPEHDYVTWKALRGDGSDNIKGIPGVGDVAAEKLVNDPEALKALFSDPEKARIFQRNYELIHFYKWSDEEAMQMTSSSPQRNWDVVGEAFDTWQFKSIRKDGAWQKFINTFDPLFGN